jgi:hypothetical protein
VTGAKSGRPGQAKHVHELDVLDALGDRGVEVTGKELITKHREALLERQVEPRGHRHTVPSPVVEELMTDDGLDALVVGVCLRVPLGEQAAAAEGANGAVSVRSASSPGQECSRYLRVEDVEGCVLHAVSVRSVSTVEEGSASSAIHLPPWPPS